MQDGDDATCLFAWQRSRDESGRALEQARRGVEIVASGRSTLVKASGLDAEVPAMMSRKRAAQHPANYLCLTESRHVCPLFDTRPARAARHVANGWMIRCP
ncbi:MAG: hypothetical protein ABIR27_08360 [Dokdonella sp.]